MSAPAPLQEIAPAAGSPTRTGVVPGRAAVYARPPLASRRFYVCLAILVGAALTMQITAGALGQYFKKLPVPLRQPLDGLWMSSRLGPEYEPHSFRPSRLSEEVEESLGTREYVDLRLVDRTRDAEDACRVAHVFITYHTGKPDLVPHRPEECRVAGGAQLLESRSVSVQVPNAGAQGDTIELRKARFALPREQIGLARTEAIEQTVLYFFHVNGLYLNTRDQVRYTLESLRYRYAYYMKVEVYFTNQQMTRLAGADESLAAAAPLLGKLMPILLADYLQDFEALERSAARGGAQGTSEQ